jgi:hypothetical protein
MKGGKLYTYNDNTRVSLQTKLILFFLYPVPDRSIIYCVSLSADRLGVLLAALNIFILTFSFTHLLLFVCIFFPFTLHSHQSLSLDSSSSYFIPPLFLIPIPIVPSTFGLIRLLHNAAWHFYFSLLNFEWFYSRFSSSSSLPYSPS